MSMHTLVMLFSLNYYLDLHFQATCNYWTGSLFRIGANSKDGLDESRLFEHVSQFVRTFRAIQCLHKIVEKRGDSQSWRFLKLIISMFQFMQLADFGWKSFSLEFNTFGKARKYYLKQTMKYLKLKERILKNKLSFFARTSLWCSLMVYSSHSWFLMVQTDLVVNKLQFQSHSWSSM